MWKNIEVFGVLDIYVLCCRCLLDLRGGPFFFKIPLQAELTAVSSYYGAMVPPTCLGYRFERWPILTYCHFNVTPSYLGHFYLTVAKSKGAAIWHSVTPQLIIQGSILSSCRVGSSCLLLPRITPCVPLQPPPRTKRQPWNWPKVWMSLSDSLSSCVSPWRDVLPVQTDNFVRLQVILSFWGEGTNNGWYLLSLFLRIFI